MWTVYQPSTDEMKHCVCSLLKDEATELRTDPDHRVEMLVRVKDRYVRQYHAPKHRAPHSYVCKPPAKRIKRMFFSREDVHNPNNEPLRIAIAETADPERKERMINHERGMEAGEDFQAGDFVFH
jgi:hypothetical protein